MKYYKKYTRKGRGRGKYGGEPGLLFPSNVSAWSVINQIHDENTGKIIPCNTDEYIDPTGTFRCIAYPDIKNPSALPNKYMPVSTVSTAPTDSSYFQGSNPMYNNKGGKTQKRKRKRTRRYKSMRRFHL